MRMNYLERNFMKRRYYLSILPLAGILFGMWYIHIAASDVI